ncbi:hypothetical protein [Hymenobacter guriensis]|uniref:DUF4168 domain-containing protein n=1 Tax=Hymenobacter guriensis TaxID=2793065 RepID=A0ABS0L525_9BACT|nr:hypothetical protein [Hymenobacter guriensis]MBG8554623.1 hypothetical protein [Hymenobacter guriensis]
MRTSTPAICAVLLFCSGSLLSGCMNTAGDTPISRQATSISRSFADEGQLNEGQYKRVRSLSIRMMREVARVQMHANSPQENETQLARIQAGYEAQLASILMPDQMARVQPLMPQLAVLHSQTVAAR